MYVRAPARWKFERCARLPWPKWEGETPPQWRYGLGPPWTRGRPGFAKKSSWRQKTTLPDLLGWALRGVEKNLAKERAQHCPQAPTREPARQGASGALQSLAADIGKMQGVKQGCREMVRGMMEGMGERASSQRERGGEGAGGSTKKGG